MGMFGWSYPPGCSGLPDDEEGPCSICGLAIDDCICPTCSVCGSVGDPSCYENHGLVRSQAQIDSLVAQEAIWNDANTATYLGELDIPGIDADWPA